MAIRNKAFSKVAALSNKVAEVELSKETVEFTVVGDIEKMAKKVKTAVGKIDSIETKAKQAQDKHEKALLKAYETSLDDRQKLLDQLEKDLVRASEVTDVLAKAENAAKELGLKAEDIKGYKELKSSFQDLRDIFPMVKNEINKIDNVKI